MKKIIVTGSSGFIGRYALPLLVKRGYEVYPLRLNLLNCEETHAQLKKVRPEALLHFAWETTPKIFWHTPSNLDWLKCSLDLLETFAICGGKRVVIAGSCAEIHPTTVYGACKEALRLSATAFLQTQNVSFAWGRIFSPFGPYEKEQRLIPSLIQKLLTDTPFTCASQNHVRDFLFIEDVAEAFVSLLDSGVEGVVDLGSGEGVRVGDLVKLIANKIQSNASIHLSSSSESADNPLSLIANPDRLIKEVGFTPRNTLLAGLDKTITWWKNEIYH